MAEKFIGNYGIGGNVLPTEVSEAILDIPQNRTLLIAKLTDRDPITPVIVNGKDDGVKIVDEDGREFYRPLQTIEQVFDHYKPAIEVEFETLEGKFKKEMVAFRNLADFGTKGITNQSPYLLDIHERKDEYKRVMKHIKSNRVLRTLLAKEDKHKAMIEILETMINELKEVEHNQKPLND